LLPLLPVVVVAALVVVVGLAGAVVELAERVVTGRVVVVVMPAATTMRGASFGITVSRTIVVTTPSATITIARGLISDGSKCAMLEATKTERCRHGCQTAVTGFVRAARAVDVADVACFRSRPGEYSRGARTDRAMHGDSVILRGLVQGA